MKNVQMIYRFINYNGKKFFQKNTHINLYYYKRSIIRVEKLKVKKI